MARKSTKNAANSTDTAMESRVEEIKTEDKAAETGVAEEKPTEDKAAEKKSRTTKKTSAKTSASEKEEAAKTDEAQKETAKEPAKAGAKKAEPACVMSVQYGGKEISGESLLKAVKSVWKDDLKRKAGDLNSVELYVKPEENKVYYVLNKEITGSLDI